MSQRFQQLLVSADRLDLAPLEHEDRVRIHERRQPVRNDDHRPTARNPANVLVDDRLAVRIKRAGRLVENQDLRVENQRPRDRQSLPLAARQIRRPFVDVRLITARKPVDELLGAGEPRRPHHLIEGRVRLGGRDVLTDRAAEQEVLLQHDAEAATEMTDVVFANVDPIDLDKAFVVRVEPLKQTRHRGLAGPAAADDAERVPDRNLEGNVVERWRRRAEIFESDLGEFNVAGQRRADAAIAVALLLRLIDQLADNGDRGTRLVILVDELRHLQERP